MRHPELNHDHKPDASTDTPQINRGPPEIPRLFSEPVVSHVDQLGHQIGRRGITGVTMTSVNGQRSSGAAVTEAVRQNARRAVEPVSAAWSSVVGVLDVISARREKRRIGLLTSEGRAVVCNVQQLPNDLVFEAFEKKVVAAGILRRNGRGQAVSLDAESLEILPTVSNWGTRGDHVVAPAGHDGMTLGVM